MADFTNIKHFDGTENWGNADLMDQRVVEILDGLCEYLESDADIHCGYELGGHKPKGYHPKAMAVDFHFKTDIDYAVQVFLVEDYLLLNDLKVGLGVYPYWNNKGFHLDVRGRDGRWMRDKNGQYTEIKYNEL